HVGGMVTCEMDEIASGMTRSVTISVEVVSELNLCNFIRVAGLEIDPEPSNNSSQNCTIGTAPTFHPADINEDLMIDANDLLELLKAWESEY
ncbi:MAG: hypothetical protein KC931_16825, partial [Candidatus Omnitrophica bacterium]|nr:hypothetical protein [Candidatus Omnitrophota bacterium]